MAFTKEELHQELRMFMHGFAESVERMYGPNPAGALIGHPGMSVHDVHPDVTQVDNTILMKCVLDMYDYGICAMPNTRFGQDQGIDGSFADVELFLRGLDSLELYFQEDEYRLPELARRTVRTAVARSVLDGGLRYTDYDDGFLNYLSIAEIALLANMDERSVRNAANPKIAGALLTENHGKRTMVTREDARRWLSGRKGFIPMQESTSEVAKESSEATLTLPQVLAQRIDTLAALAGLSTHAYLESLLEQSSGGAL